jgi:hypothetical protein
MTKRVECESVPQNYGSLRAGATCRAGIDKRMKKGKATGINNKKNRAPTDKSVAPCITPKNQMKTILSKRPEATFAIEWQRIN